MTGLTARDRAWHRIDAAYLELSRMRALAIRLRGGWGRRLLRALRLRAPDPAEAVVAEEIASLRADIRMLRADYDAMLRHAARR